jgi:hypothetical protein
MARVFWLVKNGRYEKMSADEFRSNYGSRKIKVLKKQKDRSANAIHTFFCVA